MFKCLSGRPPSYLPSEGHFQFFLAFAWHLAPTTHLSAPALASGNCVSCTLSGLLLGPERDRSTGRSGSKKPAVPSFDFQVCLLGSHRPRVSLTQGRQWHNLTTVANNPAWTLMVSVYVIGPLCLFASRRVVLQPLMCLGYFDYWV